MRLKLPDETLEERSLIKAGGNTNRCPYDAAFYANTGNNYRERLEFVLANAWRAAYILLLLRPRTILDIGGGMGLLVERFQSWGRRALGLEISHYAITQAPQTVRQSFVQADATSLPFADHSFDVVVSVNVLEHLPLPQAEAAMQECSRVARRGMYHEITVLEDRGVIHRDPTHCTKMAAHAWRRFLSGTLQQWEVRRGIHIPRYKNGIFVIKKRGEALT